MYSSKHQKCTLLKHQKPLTTQLKRKVKIDSYQFKHHYTSGNELLLDYKRYISKYIIKTVKSASQCTADVRSIWMACNPDLLINLNVLADNEIVESTFYLPLRHLLLENKDKEPHEQEPHIKAPAIRSKLNTFQSTY